MLIISEFVWVVLKKMRKDLSHSNRPHDRGLNPTRPMQHNRQQLKFCAGCWNSSCEL